MKYLVVIAVVLIGFWLWRKNRENLSSTKDDPIHPLQPGSQNLPPQIMISCVQCGVHLPSSEAVAGKLGRYCSSAHRQQKENG